MSTSAARALPREVVSCRVATATTREQAARKRWFATERQPRLNELVGQLFVAHGRQVRARLMGWGVAPGDADDVCVEVFMVALRRLPTYEGTSSISTWLMGIARKLAADHRRSARTRLEVLVDEVPERAGHADAERQLSREEELQGLRRAVAGLKPSQRAVVTAYALEEQPMNEVAREQRVPAQTAYARLYAGHAALRAVLG